MMHVKRNTRLAAPFWSSFKRYKSHKK